MMSETFWDMIFLVIVAAALVFGFWIYFYPLKVFEVQKKFYAIINWRIEPISMEKEIRNTKIMGLFLIVFVVLASFYAWRH